MTLQWTFVAVFLYAEIGLISLFLMPWIRAHIWQKIFRSKIVRAAEAYSQVFVYALGGILFLLFGDAIREVRKYSMDPAETREAIMASPNADTLINMRLFRAQRNLYIAGFACFLWLVIRRMVGMIAKEAQLTASVEAAMKQAKGATTAAAQMMSDKPESGDSEVDALKGTIEKLHKDLELATLDRDSMKKQSDAVKAEYDRLLDDFNALEQKSGDKKHD